MSIKKKNSAESKVNSSVPKGLRIASIVFIILEAVSLGILEGYLIYEGLLPDSYVTLIIGATAGLIAVQVLLLLLFRKSKVVRILIMLLCVIIAAAAYFGGYTLYSSYQQISETVVEDKVYSAYISVYVRNDSGIEDISGLEGKKIAVLTGMDQVNTVEGLAKLRESIDFENVGYEDFHTQCEALRNGDVDAIFINEAFLDIYLDDETDFDDWAVCVHRIGLDQTIEIDTVTAEVTKEPFIVYISGIDTRDYDEEFPDYSRTDSNIVAVVDPINKKISMVSIPRDYYVGLYGRSYQMDKLTHTGIYGIDCSLKTLSALLDIDFNYYVRVNFKSVVNIVDALGGIDVYSEVAFSSPHGLSGTEYSFTEGWNYGLNGDMALAFARERKSFEDGDVQRSKNEMAVIQAVLNKAMSASIIANFNQVLSTCLSCVKTNMDVQDMNALIRMQLSDMSSWTVEQYTITGYDAMDYTYSQGTENQYYVMKEDYASVEGAKEFIQNALGSSEETEEG